MQRVVLGDVDPASVEDAVGAACYARGAHDARQRAVVQMWWDAARCTLLGSVLGSTGELHTTVVYFSLGGRFPLEFEHGECDCPAGFNCQHAVAVTLTATDTARAATPGAASPRGPRSVAWEQSLESLLEPRPAAALAGRVRHRWPSS